MRLAQLSDSAFPLTLSLEQEGVGGLTGKAPTVALRDATTSASYLDWADNVFKTSGWTTKYASMSEVERGVYRRVLNIPAVAAIVAGSRLSAEYRLNEGGLIGDDAELICVVANLHTIAADASATVTAVHGAGAYDAVTPAGASAAAIADAVWDEAAADHVLAGSTGAKLGLLDAAISSRLATAGYAAPDNATIAVIRQLLRNRKVFTPGNPGTLTVYADDDITPLFTAQVTDATGAAVTSPAGAPARTTRFT